MPTGLLVTRPALVIPSTDTFSLYEAASTSVLSPEPARAAGAMLATMQPRTRSLAIRRRSENDGEREVLIM